MPQYVYRYISRIDGLDEPAETIEEPLVANSDVDAAEQMKNSKPTRPNEVRSSFELYRRIV